MIFDMIQTVKRFQVEILDYPIPEKPTPLTKKQLTALGDHLNEEVTEMMNSKNLAEQVDALVDLVYVALGALVKMGVAPKPVFQMVHEANMQKKRGSIDKRPNNEGYDAVKPVGWEPPDFTPLLEVSLFDLRMQKAESPVFKHLTQLRFNKGADYNSSDIQINDYFPFAEESYVQMIYLKALRMVALCKKARSGGKPNYEGLPGSLVDLLNYSVFFGEWMIHHGMLKPAITQTDREKEVADGNSERR